MLRFGTAGIRGSVEADITPEAIVSVSRAVATEGAAFVVGRDGRETSNALLDAATAGLVSGGATVERLGVLPTPALAFASRGRHGLMVTASHNPPADNGIKLFHDGREIDRETESRVEARLADGVSPAPWRQWGDVRSGSVLTAYRRAIEAYLVPRGSVPTDLSIVVDCGCGTASLVAPGLLRGLGATVRTLNGSIDGTFPARSSKPTPASLSTLLTFVADGPADLGIAFDGDADRIVVVDEEGSVVHEDTVVAMLGEYYVRASDCTDPVVVTTPNASNRIDDRVQAAGGRTVRTPLGQLHAGIERVESNEDTARVVFAAEPWKHLHPDFGHWIDGITSAGLLIKILAEEDLDDRRSPIREPSYRKESVPCPDEAKPEVMDVLETPLAEMFSEATLETRNGVRLTLPGEGWILVRPSGTEPKIRVYVESDAADDIVARVTDHLRRIVDDVASEATGG